MLPLAGQTAGPIGLTFFLWTLMGDRGVLKAAKLNSKIFFNIFLPWATPGPSASPINNVNEVLTAILHKINVLLIFFIAVLHIYF